MSKLWNIAIVGADSTIGEQVAECLEERAFPVGRMKFMVEAGSAGEPAEFAGKALMLEEIKPGCFDGIDLVFFAADDDCSRRYCPLAVKSGAVVVDLSGAWRMDAQVPLVVPEVNPEALAGYAAKGIVASPDPMTAQVAVAVKPLHDAGTIKRMVVSTYQAVSMDGKQAIDELHHQVLELLNGRSPESGVYPHRIAFNCLPQVDVFLDNGQTAQERRLTEETCRILGSDIKISATAVLVPVFYGHCASINLETERPVGAAAAMELLGRAAGCELADDVMENVYPMPLAAAGQDQVLVGRVRDDGTIANGLNLWIAADNTRKGAALNAVQIAESLIDQYLK